MKDLLRRFRGKFFVGKLLLANYRLIYVTIRGLVPGCQIDVVKSGLGTRADELRLLLGSGYGEHQIELPWIELPWIELPWIELPSY